MGVKDVSLEDNNKWDHYYGRNFRNYKSMDKEDKEETERTQAFSSKQEVKVNVKVKFFIGVDAV